jgi:4-hydroxybenzoate polyprenyltransferase
MKSKTSPFICISMGILSLLIAIYKSNSWPWIIASLIIASIGFIFCINQIVLKDNASKRKYYLLIILIGFIFLLFGILK